MEEKLVLPTVNFTRFGKLVSPTVIFGAKNIHQQQLLVKVWKTRLSDSNSYFPLPTKNSSQSQVFWEMKLKIKKTKKKKKQ